MVLLQREAAALRLDVRGPELGKQGHRELAGVLFRYGLALREEEGTGSGDELSFAWSGGPR